MGCLSRRGIVLTIIVKPDALPGVRDLRCVSRTEGVPHTATKATGPIRGCVHDDAGPHCSAGPSDVGPGCAFAGSGSGAVVLDRWARV